MIVIQYEDLIMSNLKRKLCIEETITFKCLLFEIKRVIVEISSS